MRLSSEAHQAAHAQVEINPIIANDVTRDRFKDFSGGIYVHPRVQVFVDDGGSFVRRTEERYDVIQASLVDTWAATAAGAYTLTENTLACAADADVGLGHERSAVGRRSDPGHLHRHELGISDHAARGLCRVFDRARLPVGR